MMLLRRFAREYHQTIRVMRLLKKARMLARDESISREDALAQLGRDTAAQALAGALYLCTVGKDFAETLETAACWCPGGAAVAGTILGAIGGEEAIPAGWLEELECADVLRELAGDLFGGCPMMKGSRIFDVEWDEKYNSADL
jgi:ADP-ribosylglycohydrolase